MIVVCIGGAITNCFLCETSRVDVSRKQRLRNCKGRFKPSIGGDIDIGDSEHVVVLNPFLRAPLRISKCSFTLESKVLNRASKFVA